MNKQRVTTAGVIIVGLILAFITSIYMIGFTIGESKGYGNGLSSATSQLRTELSYLNGNCTLNVEETLATEILGIRQILDLKVYPLQFCNIALIDNGQFIFIQYKVNDSEITRYGEV